MNQRTKEAQEIKQKLQDKAQKAFNDLNLDIADKIKKRVLTYFNRVDIAIEDDDMDKALKNLDLIVKNLDKVIPTERADRSRYTLLDTKKTIKISYKMR